MILWEETINFYSSPKFNDNIEENRMNGCLLFLKRKKKRERSSYGRDLKGMSRKLLITVYKRRIEIVGILTTSIVSSNV